ncbi:MAG: signal peptidase I [Fimbriimonas sp.]|nr:signal peptidase I [Fimbriimonas sp.]
MPYLTTLLPLAQSQPAGTREIVDALARTPLSRIVIFVTVLTVLRVAIFPILKNTKPHLRFTAYKSAHFANETIDALVYAAVFVFMLIRPFGVQAFLVPSGSMWPTLYVNDFIVANKAIYRYTEPKANDIVVFRPPATAQIKPEDVDSDGEMKTDYVKRCIGAPGDLIELKKGVLYRNGKIVDETYKTYSEGEGPQVDGETQNFRKLTDEEKSRLTIASFKLVEYKGQVIPFDYTDFDGNAIEPRPGNVEEIHPPYAVAQKFQIATPHDQNMLKAQPAVKVPSGYFLMMGDNRNNSWDGRVWGLVPRDQIIGRAEFVWWPISAMRRLH